MAHRTHVSPVRTNAQAAVINHCAWRVISNIIILQTQQSIASAALKTVSAAPQAQRVQLV